MLRLLARPSSYRTLIHHRIERLAPSILPQHHLTRTMSSLAAESSSEPPAPQNGPLPGPGEPKSQQPRLKKDKAQTAASQYPLEVRISILILNHHHHDPDDDHVDARRQLQPPPDYIDHRIQMFERLRAKYVEFVRGVSFSIRPLRGVHVSGL